MTNRLENIVCEPFTFDPSKDVNFILNYGLNILSTYTFEAERMLNLIKKLDSEIEVLLKEKEELETQMYLNLHSYLCLEINHEKGPKESIDKNYLKLKSEMAKFKDLSNFKNEERDTLKKEVKRNNDQCKNLKEAKENIGASLKENEPLKAEFKMLSAILNLGYKNNSEGIINTVLLKEKESTYRSFKFSEQDKNDKKTEEEFWKALELRERLKIKGKF